MAHSNNDIIRIAIELFRASQESKTPQGLSILTNLDAFFKRGGIILAPLPPGLEGRTDGNTIELNQLDEDPARLSVWLVHEGYHTAAKPDELEIDEEIQSRLFQCRYMQTLMTGIKVEGKQYRIPELSLMGTCSKGKVVDLVVGNSAYTDKLGFLTQSWVVKHIQDEGGPGNRELETKKKYVSVLIERPKPVEIGSVARALFDILSSSKIWEARDLVEHAGGGSFYRGKEIVKERIGQAMWGAHPATTQFYNRVLMWQRQTFIDLGFR